MIADWIPIDCLEMEQPLGQFAVAIMDGKTLARLSRADVHRLEENPSHDDFWKYVGIQRKVNKSRVQEIASFVEAADAAFPTSILVAVDEENARVEDGKLFVRDLPGAFRVLDGQHRLAGLDAARLPENERFDVQVTILVGPSWELQAHVFTAVNANQKAINPSLAKNLLQFSRIQTPEKVLHQIARSMNADRDGPFYDLIKMIGYREQGSSAMLTQHAFIEGLSALIYNSAKHRVEVRSKLSHSAGNRKKLQAILPVSSRRPLRDFYLHGEDAAIRKILDSYFSAMKSTFSDEWGNPEFILTKTTGFYGMVGHLRLLLEKGLRQGKLTRQFFDAAAQQAKQNLETKQQELTSAYFPPGRPGEKELESVLCGG